jgi:hypothetical protein
MRTRTLCSITTLWLTAACLTAALFLSSCDNSSDPMGPGVEPEEEFPTTYPPIPRPSTPDETIPDESEIYTAISPIAGKNIDFAPVWTDGVFTWNVDIQTQYDRILGGWMGDPPGDYWNGTTHNSNLTFEGGKVDLRDPTPFGTSWGDPHPRRVLFIEDGVALDTPRNPDRAYVLFQFQGGYPERRFAGALFGGYEILKVDPAFGERERQRAYYVAAMSCGQLQEPVYVQRERFWKRLPLVSEGSNLKSIRVDPGASFAVTYMRTQGTSYKSSYTFTRSLNGELSVGGDSSPVGGKLGGSLSEAFGSEKEITEETSVEVTRTMSGIDGKTVVYSVWTSVERYSIVDKDGNPYTDPNFTFEDLGTALIQGEYEWISSTQFDYE